MSYPPTPLCFPLSCISDSLIPYLNVPCILTYVFIPLLPQQATEDAWQRMQQHQKNLEKRNIRGENVVLRPGVGIAGSGAEQLLATSEKSHGSRRQSDSIDINMG